MEWSCMRVAHFPWRSQRGTTGDFTTAMLVVDCPHSLSRCSRAQLRTSIGLRNPSPNHTDVVRFLRTAENVTIILLFCIVNLSKGIPPRIIVYFCWMYSPATKWAIASPKGVLGACWYALCPNLSVADWCSISYWNTSSITSPTKATMAHARAGICAFASPTSGTEPSFTIHEFF